MGHKKAGCQKGGRPWEILPWGKVKIWADGAKPGAEPGSTHRHYLCCPEVLVDFCRHPGAVVPASKPGYVDGFLAISAVGRGSGLAGCGLRSTTAGELCWTELRPLHANAAR